MMSGMKRTFGLFLENHLHFRWDPQIAHHNIEGGPPLLLLSGVERSQKKKKKKKKQIG